MTKAEIQQVKLRFGIIGNNKNCRIPMQRAAIAQIEKADDAVEE